MISYSLRLVLWLVQLWQSYRVINCLLCVYQCGRVRIKMTIFSSRKRLSLQTVLLHKNRSIRKIGYSCLKRGMGQ